jgi:DHA1 family multidrug resistance protein-like MFS transporter
MYDVFRDSAFGQTLRFLMGRSLAPYLEEKADFQSPVIWAPESGKSTSDSVSSNERDDDAEKAHTPQKQGNDTTVVTWYSDTDPENPHNWSRGKKAWVGFLILIYTLSVYIGASLYTASVADIVSIFGVSEVAASLGLALYVMGYGIGPLLFSPLPEIPTIGRNPPYIVTYAIFVILCVPTSLVSNFAGILVLRTLLGFFGSPCLATAGASYGDFCGGKEMPYVIAFWGGGATGKYKAVCLLF